jgi:hypothetical protein
MLPTKFWLSGQAVSEEEIKKNDQYILIFFLAHLAKGNVVFWLLAFVRRLLSVIC